MATERNTPRAVRIEITPSPEEYRRLCEDLGELRKRGAETNTAAIVQAVRDAASSGGKMAHPKRSRGARKRPPVQQEG